MVLAELGSKLTNALKNLATSTVVDSRVVDELLKEIGNALIASDVNVRLVFQLRQNIKSQINLEELAGGVNKRKIIHQIVFEELCKLLDSGCAPYEPIRGRCNVIMFVGLQGSGKTTTVTKLALQYKKRGWKSCLVCADTFRAGAFDQLKQNATKVRVPFYGSYNEADPVKIALEGVNSFKEEGYEIIIVDTSGRHKQEADLFEEMQQVAQAVNPDNIVFVMDGSIGQAAFDQAVAFKEKVAVGSVIITKMDSHANGGGALSAVAATKSPVLYIGTGEHMEDLEPFSTRPFVSKLLGMGDLQGLVRKIKEVVPMNDEGAMQRLSQGIFTLRDMKEQFANIQKMGPMNQVLEMLPGMNQILKQIPGAGNDSSARIRLYMTIMDSMTDQELDDKKIWENKVKSESRIARIARGSGRQIREVNELLDQFKYFENMMKNMKKLAKGGQMNTRNMGQLANMLPSNLLKQVGGAGGLQQLMKGMNANMFDK
eukprot:TRINITY_DN4117_c0_g1_i1.p1 TRINITY_DN4117_c0_g1~~TRINITY_DN4117_c0_g1_i1.p1  ORF type:complete len:485 (+),score=176.80 TRINITY_DN4117_c0_g1_i1:101-1555(+)